jgi:omega-6 fatty acid desaturase (delta-12 desaturase)
MAVEPAPGNIRAGAATLAESVQPFARPDRKRATWQIIDTLVPYFALWALMIVMVQQSYPYWSVLALSALVAAFYVRVFILFHDCTHGSLFATPRANRILGYVTGILTFTPFEQWRRSHAMHHDTVGDLDRRGVGDIWTMTAAEFDAAPRLTRVAYRIIRNPFFVLTCGTIIIFLISPRFFHKLDRMRERRSVIITDVALAAIIAVAVMTIGIETYLMIQIPVMLTAGGQGYGSSTSSISSKGRTGSATRRGTRSRRHWKGARSTGFPESCSGSPAISDSTISITCCSESPTTTSNGATSMCRCCSRSSRSPSSAV